MTEAVCCIDMGTTRIKAALVDDGGRLLSSARVRAPPCGPWNGFLSFDVAAYEAGVFQALRETLAPAGARAARVAAVAVTGQRATVLGVGPDGVPLTPALSWQDTSSQACLDAWARRFGRDRFAGITGLPPGALWSLPKLLRLRSLATGLPFESTRFVLLHDRVLHGLGAPRFVTDPSNASVTGLMDLASRVWSAEILDAAGLSEAQLPAIVPAASPAGAVSREAARRTGLARGTPLVVGGGDQQCAALGSGTLSPGDAALCLGTAAVVSCPLERPAAPPPGGFFCTAHVAPGRWVLEGIQNGFFTSILWMSEMLGCDPREGFDRLAEGAAPGAAGLTFLPFLAGVGSPEFDARATGTLQGLRQTHTRGDLARAALEGICLEMRRILDAAGRHAGVRRLLVSGGGLPGPRSRETLWRALGREMVEIENVDTSLAGAAMLAWRGAGRFESLEAAAAGLGAAAAGPSRPAARDEAYERVYAGYLRAVHQALAGPGGPPAQPPRESHGA